MELISWVLVPNGSAVLPLLGHIRDRNPVSPVARTGGTAPCTRGGQRGQPSGAAHSRLQLPSQQGVLPNSHTDSEGLQGLQCTPCLLPQSSWEQDVRWEVTSEKTARPWPALTRKDSVLRF